MKRLFQNDGVFERPSPWRGFAIAAFLVVALLAPCVGCGPWITWYNESHRERAIAAGLVGRPEADVERVLGSASSIEGRGLGRTFNYHPIPGWPFSKFQVHCMNGVVTGLEMFDD